ncbi:MAG: hypothetical protein K6A65_07195, partial [Succinivibrionaceae bacterium]|nr:hypothetical protein [Succinivibrionaceae bacterium]
AVAPAVAGQPHVQRNASAAEIFTATEQLRARQGELNLKDGQIEDATRLMEGLHCTDQRIIVALAKGSASIRAKSFSDPAVLTIPSKFRSLSSNIKDEIEALSHSTGLSRGEAAALYAESIATLMGDGQVATLMETARRQECKTMLEVFNTAAKEPERVTEQDRQGKAADFERGMAGYCQGAKDTLSVLESVFSHCQRRLGEQPAPLFDHQRNASLYELPASNDTASEMQVMVPYSYTGLDMCMIALHEDERPGAEDRALLNAFYKGLRISMPEGHPQELGSYNNTYANPFKVTYQGPDGRQRTQAWNPSHLAGIMGGHAKELAQLLRETQGQPTAAQAWEVLRPGKPVPEGLSMANLADSIMRSVVTEGEEYAAMTGQGSFNTEINIGSHLVMTGIPIDRFISLMGNCATDDVQMDYQQMKASGMLRYDNNLFAETTAGTEFADGSESFGFAKDFVRTIPPRMEAGAEPLANPLFSLAIQGGKTFTGTELTAQEGNSQRKAYCDGIADEVRKICKNNNQLSGVAVACGQAMEGSFRMSGYRNVSPGGEHTALDYVVRPLDNGNVEVKISEKPGALVKFRHTYEVDQAGMIHIKEARTTLPSLQKIAAYNQVNASKIL